MEVWSPDHDPLIQAHSLAYHLEPTKAPSPVLLVQNVSLSQQLHRTLSLYPTIAPMLPRRFGMPGLAGLSLCRLAVMVAQAWPRRCVTWKQRRSLCCCDWHDLHTTKGSLQQRGVI